MATLDDLFTKTITEMTDEELDAKYHALSRMRVICPTPIRTNKAKRTKSAEASLPKKMDDLSIEQIQALIAAKQKGNL